MTFREGFKVWVEDKMSAWKAAEVVGLVDEQVQVVTASGEKLIVLPEKLFPRDPDAEDHGGVDDMTRLTFLSEAGILSNLERRYALNEIYTYTGNILIAVNPFTHLPHLYNVHMMDQYKGVPFGDLSPHVFAVADAAYRAMLGERRSQSILVSGESGAGKTETTKLIMQYLTHVGGRAAKNDRTVEQQVLESNPLLEAFGNARTVRNDNSSRFGKFVEIHFDSSGKISGAAVRTYLLERSRVVQITPPERNYHCFYQLCSSCKDIEKYKLAHPSQFHYLNQSEIYELVGVSDIQEYLNTRRAMDVVGINKSDQDAIFRSLAAILHLGNVEFCPGNEHDSSIISDKRSLFHLNMAANLFMCDVDLLLASLSTRSIQTREGTIIKALDCKGALGSRDALAKTVYARIFDWLVDRINTSVRKDPNSKLQIGVLDIYGFESFPCNSLEQFCINYANEKLQQHFNEHVFKMEQEEYRKEEINWSYIEFVDNQDVLDLIEKRPIGIIALLDEDCLFPKSTSETFSNKLFQNFQSHSRLEKTKFSRTNFTLHHYAGKVTYQTDRFLEKNRDYVVAEHCNLLSCSGCRFIADLFPSVSEEFSKSSYKFSSVASRFKQQLQTLMDTLSVTEPHYIRCVKPNSVNSPRSFDKPSVLHQLHCGGVLEAVRISLAGYPTRRTYSEFINRYGLLAQELMDGCHDEKRVTKKILNKLKLENFQLGKTKTYLRAGQIAVLDSRRAEVLDKAAKLIQRKVRVLNARKIFVANLAAASIIQAYCRGCLARYFYLARRNYAAAILIQRYSRRWLQRRCYTQLYSVAILLQSILRASSVRKNYIHHKRHKAALKIQAFWRMWKGRSAFYHSRSCIISIQCLWRSKCAKREFRKLKEEANEAGSLRLAKGKLEKQLEDLAWRLQLEKRLRASLEEVKAAEVYNLQRELQILHLELDAAKFSVYNESNKNVVLQQQLEQAVNEKSALEKEMSVMLDLRKENSLLKISLDTLEKKNSCLERELALAQGNCRDAIETLSDVEQRCTVLQQNIHSLESMFNMEKENQDLSHQTSPKRTRLPRNFSEDYNDPMLSNAGDIFESTPRTKLISPFSCTSSDPRQSKLISRKDQEKFEILSECIKSDLGFSKGKPVAACALYKWLLHWHTFESGRNSIFSYVIECIEKTLKVGNETITLSYWLSNISALLCLVERNSQSHHSLLSTYQRSLGFSCKVVQGMKSTSLVEARYPVLFKQQLTAYVEKIFSMLRDNMKKETSSLLSSCIQASKLRIQSGMPFQTRRSIPQPSQAAQWDCITKLLDSLMIHLRENHVPSFFIRKLVTQVFSCINMTLFNSLLLRRECCSFSSGEYLKSGLAELEKWIVNTTEEFSGTAWHELNCIRQAVGFLVLHQKKKKKLHEIRQDLCPSLNIRQIYRISTMYWDDKYGTQSVSNEVVAEMREILASPNAGSNSFLLDDDLSIPFTTEDIYKAIPAIDASDVEVPGLCEYSSPRLLHSGS